MTYAETNLVSTIERLSGNRILDLTQAQRDQVDQFHAGGAEAVERLLPGLRLSPDMTVLDVGAGFGGPARQVARVTGCRVVGIDLTPAYVDAAREMSEAAGLADRVEFWCTDVSAFDRDGFDAAFTMHVQMNVADKPAFFAEIARRLRPGARLAVYEVCRNAAAEPEPPLPWSLDGADSFLVTPDDLRRAVEDSGFRTVEWVDETPWVRGWFATAGARVAAAGARAVLPALLDDGPVRMQNYAAALASDVVSVYRGSFALALSGV